MKTKLEEHKGVWADELPKVLRAYRTTSRTSTGETPFSLAYRVEAMILVEVGIPSLRRETYNSEENHSFMCYELDLLEEKCDLEHLEPLHTNGLKGTSIPKLRREGSKKAT